jgi:hypothetical protein
MNPQSHIIGKTVLELNTGRLGDVAGLQTDLSHLLWQQALPAMAQLFDRLVSENEVVRLDQVVVELPPLDQHYLADDFMRYLLSALEQSLSDHLAGYHPPAVEASSPRLDRAAADWEILLYFLRYGRLPWWETTNTWDAWLSRWEAVMQGDTRWQLPVRQQLTFHTVRDRLIAQFPESFRHQLVLQLQPTWLSWRALLAQAHRMMQGLTLSNGQVQALDHIAWQLLLTELAKSDGNRPLPTATWVRRWLSHLIQSWQLTGTLTNASAVSANGPSTPRVDTRRRSLTGTEGPSRTPQPGPSALPPSLADETVRQYWQRLIATILATDQALWLSALHQVLEPGTVRAADAATPEPRAALDSAAAAARSATAAAASDPINPAAAPASPVDFTAAPARWLDLAAAASNPINSTAAPTHLPDARSMADALEADLYQPSSQRSLDEAALLSPEEEVAGIYLNQAGLVLLHPFLRPYFEDVGLLREDHFQDATCQQTAIYLLHYLATRQTDAPEYELVLPKLLCGWPLNEPVMSPELPPAALQEAEHLLQTVIDYWQALKSTSADGLREGFLQRQGKLARTGDNAWKLQVEQQSIDILLSRLPWGISVVKLPWMETLLMVEWT